MKPLQTADASFPYQAFYLCVDDDNIPAGYTGEWPVKGCLYSGKAKYAAYSDATHVYLDGFWAAEPWGAFAAERFRLFTCICLN